ncbi:MAG: exodeoxyribonuclease VII small subunit [SAR324 cluster bacterium]|nr:exodeoxyribonuclease VII small subunit [SAR324 cluster bacterium]
MEEALQAFEEGIRHSRDCHRLLQRAEERIEMILKNEHGEYEVVPIKETK